jgi:hypothetical protein
VVMVERLPPSSFTYAIAWGSEPMFYKHVIDLQSHCTLENVHNLKKSNSDVTWLQLIIQKMHNHDKDIHFGSRHP